MAGQVRFHDFEPALDDFLADALAGLGAPRKWLPPKYFYDSTGSRLFEAICKTPEYYPTRTETALLREHAGAMAALIGPSAVLVEPGAGSLDKVRWLLGCLRPAAYVPLDISGVHLLQAANRLASDLPELQVVAVCMDYMRGLDGLAELNLPADGRRVVFFPGSTIGNFEPPDARGFLREVARWVGPGGGLLIGVDLKKDPSILHRAYNDDAGHTRDFNRNLLKRMNAELGADFEVGRFDHYAYYQVPEGRIEMHVVSRGPQTVTIRGQHFAFRDGESIHTENSYKYAPEEFTELAASAGLHCRQTWMDAGRLFSVHYFEV